MKQTALFNSCYKNFFETENKINKVLGEISDLLDGGKTDMGSYEYILGCTNIYNASDEDDVIARQFLLSLYDENPKFFASKDQAFTLFFLVCFHFYRQGNAQVFHDVLQRYVGEGGNKFSFEEYPVIWDLCCRYAVNTNNYPRLLASAVAGSKAMPNNPALSNSYVSAVTGRSHDMYYKNVVAVKGEFPPFIDNKFAFGADEESYEASLIKAFGFVRAGIVKNPKYAKYYFQLGQLLFYARAYFSTNKNLSVKQRYRKAFEQEMQYVKSLEACKYVNDIVWLDIAGEDGISVKENIEKFVSLAKSLASSTDEASKYNQFWDMALAFFDKRPDTVFANKNKIMVSQRFEDCLSLVKCKPCDDYVTVSYSRKDYKSVLCDIVELRSRGVQVVFDEHLDETNDAQGKTWDEKFNAILKGSKAVLCYLSENYIASSAVKKELKMMKENGKVVMAVDLTGKKQISVIIEEAIKHGLNFSSDMLRSLTDVFDDDRLVFVREKNYDATSHFEKLETSLRNQCPEVFKNVVATSCSLQNAGRVTPHPQEDAYMCDAINKVYVIADGITRFEGYPDSDYSIAAKYTRTFCKNLVADICDNLKKSSKDLPELIHKSFVSCAVSTTRQLQNDAEFARNLALAKAESVKKGTYFEPVGCVAVVGVVDNDTLYFGHVGDCAAVLVRNGQAIALTRSQTRYAFKVDNVEGDRKLLYQRYVNVPSNEHGYGVADGDENVGAFLRVTSFKLQSGDVVFLMSDGVADFFCDTFCSDYARYSAEEILAKQVELSPKDAVFDDRTIIRVAY